MELSQEQLDQFQNDLRIVKFKMQEMTDLMEGRIRSANITEYRNTVVFNDWGNLDSTYDFIMDFELDEKINKLVECKVSFKIRNFNIGVKNI
ncbi:MAG: hypothetical protein U9O59_02145 [Actinomycetota bacterium]|nr:hypothetical protein [Actinomycetota bacterium]